MSSKENKQEEIYNGEELGVSLHRKIDKNLIFLNRFKKLVNILRGHKTTTLGKILFFNQ